MSSCTYKLLYSAAASLGDAVESEALTRKNEGGTTMRDTMFRGKRIEYGEWVYGYLIGDDVIVGNIIEFNDEYFNTSFWYKVRPETVGQYTGLRDRNGREIYEGDIVNVQHFLVETIKPYRAVIEWDKYRYAIRNLGKPDYQLFHYPTNNLDPFGLDIEVIGNRYEHPELLEG